MPRYKHALQHLLVPEQNFRRAVLQGTTERVEELARGHLGCAAKVNQLDVEALIYNDVFVLHHGVRMVVRDKRVDRPLTLISLCTMLLSCK